MQGKAQRRPTSEDVAREAGVSRATVSYALNGDPDSRLRPATKQRVHDAAERLGYHPTAAARLLSGAKSRTILFLSPPEDGLQPLLTQYVVQLARELAGYRLGLLWQMGVPGVPMPVGELSPALVLTSPTRDDPGFAALAMGFTVPVIPAFPGRDAFIGSAGGVQVEFMISRGYREIVFVQATDPADGRMSAEREVDARRAADQAGVLISTVTWPQSPDAAVRLLSALASRADAPALCVYNDDLALQMLSAARNARIDVPGQLGVIGVDDTFAGRFSEPALTTVSSDQSPFIPRFARYIASLVDGETPDAIEMDPHRTVVVRSSTR